MPISPRHYGSLAVVLEKQLHHLSAISSSSSSSSPSTSNNMKIGKAPELLKKAATMFRGKASAARARLLIITSLRRRMAMIGTISHRIHALMVEKEKACSMVVDCSHALAPRKAARAGCGRKPAAGHDHDEEETMATELSELALFDQEHHHGYHDWSWTHSLFSDDNCYNDEDNGGGDVHGDVLLGEFGDGDEPSVIDIIRSNREDEGLEFNIDDEIDQAADMFIRRFRKRMNRSL